MHASTLRLCLFLVLSWQVSGDIIPLIALRVPSASDYPASCFPCCILPESKPPPEPPITQQQAERGILDRLVRKMLYHQTSGEDLTREVQDRIEQELFFLAHNF